MTHQVVQKVGSDHVIHDPRIVDPLPGWVFDPDALASRSLVHATGHGRRQVWFFALNGHELVLRHYWRGGIVSRLSADVYVWTGLERTRAFREWRLLAQLHDRGLPAPRPVAARVQQGTMAYRADLITVAIPGATPFDEVLQGPAAGDRSLWHRVGLTLGRFHAAGACHADLNVRNILLDEAGAVWVIDWDRGRLRHPDWRWQEARLERLRHSLRGQSRLNRAAHVGWPALLAGHAEAVGALAPPDSP